MIFAPVRSRFLFEGRRLDARYFTSPGVLANERLTLHSAAGVGIQTIREMGDVEHVTRFKRVVASPAEPSIPFLRAFDVFEYLPEPADRISETRTENIDGLRIEPGVILQTRSGRNLGPSVLSDSYLARFIPSDDLLRVRIANEDDRLYTFAFLNSASGQDLLRLDRTGSVIDHLSAAQVANQTVPIFTDIYDRVIERTRRAAELRASARDALTSAVDSLASAVKLPIGRRPREGWRVNAASLCGRLDSAFHDANVRQTRLALLDAGGVLLSDVAAVRKPPGRFKTYYVEPEHGQPILSGRQLLQATPVALKYISPRSLGDAIAYRLEAGMIACQADGRAEESLGQPVVITDERDGWLASGHVARIRPFDEEDRGWIWASLATRAVRNQMASLACGSVVDALYPDDMETVVLPPRGSIDVSAANHAWNQFDEAVRLDSEARTLVEGRFQQVG